MSFFHLSFFYSKTNNKKKERERHTHRKIREYKESELKKAYLQLCVTEKYLKMD